MFIYNSEIIFGQRRLVFAAGSDDDKKWFSSYYSAEISTCAQTPATRVKHRTNLPELGNRFLDIAPDARFFDEFRIAHRTYDSQPQGVLKYLTSLSYVS